MLPRLQPKRPQLPAPPSTSPPGYFRPTTTTTTTTPSSPQKNPPPPQYDPATRHPVFFTPHLRRARGPYPCTTAASSSSMGANCSSPVAWGYVYLSPGERGSKL